MKAFSVGTDKSEQKVQCSVKFFGDRALVTSLWVIQRSCHIDKSHKNNNSFIIPNFVIKIVFLSTLLYILGAGGRKIGPRFLLMEFDEV